jgi:hypothetical protein
MIRQFAENPFLGFFEALCLNLPKIDSKLGCIETGRKAAPLFD